jgi:bifunctional non-homologous end joining protein LigD
MAEAHKRTRAKKKTPITIEAPQERRDYRSLVERIKRKLKHAPAAEMPPAIKPMLATLSKDPFNDSEWLFEIKWDGYRAMAYVNNGKVDLRSRNQQSFNNTYAPIVASLQNWPVNAVVDGEIVVLNEEGKSDFEALQNFQRTPAAHIVYYVFDIVWLDGLDLTSTPLEERKQILQQLVPDNSLIKYSDSIDAVGADFYKVAIDNELEGIVGKRKSSVYTPGKRSNDWLKFPTEVRQEFVIGGWSESESGRPFKSLLFGYYENGKLQYLGHAGGGYKEAEMPAILARLQKLETKKKPFANEVESDTAVHWIKPTLVAEIKFASLTSAGKVRKPAIFLGFRNDKESTDVVKEVDVPAQELKQKSSKKITPAADSHWPQLQAQKIENSSSFSFEGKQVELTNIDRKLWGDFTKADLLLYYHSVYPFIINHLRDRPLSLHIKPFSPTAPGLYIKDMEGNQPEWAEIFSVERKHKKSGKRDQIDYLVCNYEATLQYIINLGCIDVNPWTSRTMHPHTPDYIVIDLDPSDKDFSKVIAAAMAAKEVFDNHKLTSFVKTSGKTGMHLLLPCKDLSFAQARYVAEWLCQQIHSLLPEVTATDVSVDARGDRLYLDPNQNDFADTIAAPYCLRPYKHMQVSTPLHWKEVNQQLNPSHFNIQLVLQRLKRMGDIWSDLGAEKNKTKNTKVFTQLLEGKILLPKAAASTKEP